MDTLTIVVLLLVANGFFVAAEFALVKARGFRIEREADSGSASARLTLAIQRNLEAYLAACQLGITMASLGLGWVGEPAVAAVIEPVLRGTFALSETTVHTIAFVIGFLVFSSLHIVIGEQVPKTYAIRRPEPVSVAFAYPLHAFYVVFLPLNWLLNKASGGLLAMLNIDTVAHEEVLTAEDLSGLIDVSHKGGELGSAQATRLKNLFQFDERPVSRIMVPRGQVHYLDVNEPGKCEQVIRTTGHSRMPLVNGSWERLLGVVLVKDLLAALLDEEERPWRDLRRFVREPLVVPETQKIARLFDSMREKRAHMAFVLDEYGEFVGLVTMEDLLEEIVGDIADELDDTDAVPAVTPIADGWRADGLVPLADLERLIGLKVNDELDANTLSGLMMSRLERMPVVGDVIVESGFRISVESMGNRRVEWAKLTQESESTAEDLSDVSDSGGSTKH